MLTREAQIAGAIARSRRTRAAYLLNPNRCLNDNVPIVWSYRQRKLTQIKARRFCGKSCSATYFNRLGKKTNTRRFGPYSRHPVCAGCHEPISKTLPNAYTMRYCRECKPAFEARMRDQPIRGISRDYISAHARKVTADRPRACVRCGFAFGVQACHIRDVAGFPLDTQLSVVNAPENLVLLCPNDHWLFDHEDLTIEQIAEDARARGMGLV